MSFCWLDSLTSSFSDFLLDLFRTLRISYFIVWPCLFLKVKHFIVMLFSIWSQEAMRKKHEYAFGDLYQVGILPCWPVQVMP